MEKQRILESIRGGLIVSCQTSYPMNGPEFMGPMAEAAVRGGAVGIRADGEANVSAIRNRVNVPIIGINKQRQPEYQVYITPTLEAAIEVIEAGAEIVALDGSTAPRPGGITLRELIRGVKERGALVMADISTLSEGLVAAEQGADILSSTLSGYTPYSAKMEGPDLALVEDLAQQTELPVIAEGRYSTPEDVRAAFDCGAFAVVVGRAITEPQLITKRFASVTPRNRASESGL